MKNLWIGCILLLASCVVSFAGPLTYECDVIEEREVSTRGPFDPGLGIYVGKTFHVERETGTVLGAGLANSSYASKTVIDPGSEDSSFKMIWMSKVIKGTIGARNAVYLEIKEWAPSDAKPFVLVENGTVLTGLCK